MIWVAPGPPLWRDVLEEEEVVIQQGGATVQDPEQRWEPQRASTQGHTPPGSSGKQVCRTGECVCKGPLNADPSSVVYTVSHLQGGHPCRCVLAYLPSPNRAAVDFLSLDKD